MKRKKERKLQGERAMRETKKSIKETGEWED